MIGISRAVRLVVAGTVALAGGASVSAAGAQQVAGSMIIGTVTDTGKRAITAGDVALDDTHLPLRAGNEGRFQFMQVPPGNYDLVIRSVGFEPARAALSVGRNDTVHVTVTLAPQAAQRLGAVTVTGEAKSIRMEAFDSRRKNGMGEFFTAEEIDKRGAMRVADVLRQSKTVELIPSGGNRLFAMSRRSLVGNGTCPMQLIVDGIPFNGMPDLQNRLDHRPIPVDLNTLMSAKELAGVEIYAGSATVPPEFNAGPQRSCGVIVIWTKDR